jgi:hypothetical protein
MQELTQQQQMDFERSMLNEQIESNPNSVYADSMREEKVSNIIAQLNPELLLGEIEHRIRGEKRDHLTGQWTLISKEGPAISEELVQNYISFLNVYLTQNNSLSNYSAEEINNIMSVVIDYVRDDLSDNAEKYGLTKKKEIEVKTTVKLLKRIVREEVSYEIEYTKVDPFSKYILRKKEEVIKKPIYNRIVCMEENPIETTEKIEISEEITDYNQFTKIGHIVCQSTFSVLKQAQNGMLASRIFKALRVNETLNQGGQKSKLDFLKFW